MLERTGGSDVSQEAVVWTKKNSPYSGSAYIVHLMMADLANSGYEYRLFCGDAYFASDAHVSVKTVRRVRRQMVEDGFLEILDGRAHRGKPVEYRFLMPGFSPDAPRDWEDDSAGKVDNSDQKVDNSDQKVDNQESTPITNLKNNSAFSDENRRVRKYNRYEYPAEFDALYAAYPRRIAKATAYRAYRASLARGVLHSDLAASVVAYAAAVAEDGTEVRYIMHPATFWGPDERWRDHDTASSWSPSPLDLDRARVYDEWAFDGCWSLDGQTYQSNPELTVDLPRHPAGGMFDARGRRYTVDPQSGERNYMPVAGRAAQDAV